MDSLPAFAAPRPFVLVVDDEPAVNDTIASYLRMCGFEVTQAFDPESGLDALRRRCPDLVIMDCCMPGETGAEVLETAASEGCRPPALLISGIDEMLCPRRHARARIVRRLNKPIPMRELANFIAAFCAREQAVA